ncbi:hypothetical protein PAXINDRAFT_125668, partial [Paxillus involutus ATCC 200175]
MAEQPSSFHVYRIGGLLGDDKVVKARDKTTSLYYLKGSRDATQWKFSLHADGPDGALICRVCSAYVGPPTLCGLPPGPILITMVSERRSIPMERRRGTPEGTRWFRGPDHREYRWESNSHLWRNEMQVRSCCCEVGDLDAVTYCGPFVSALTHKERSWQLTVPLRWPCPRMASCSFIRYEIRALLGVLLTYPQR